MVVVAAVGVIAVVAVIVVAGPVVVIVVVLVVVVHGIGKVEVVLLDLVFLAGFLSRFRTSSRSKKHRKYQCIK